MITGIILGLIAGLFIGILITTLISSGKIAELDFQANWFYQELEKAEDRIINRNKFISKQTAEINELRNKNIDLENNLELVTYNLSAQKKKLYVPDCESK